MKALAFLLALGAGAAQAQDPASGPACAPLAPFYWEIGDATGVLASGSVKAGRMGFTRDSVLQIASASKWIYGAFVDQTKGGALGADDLKYLNLESGWTKFSQCGATATVGSCAATTGYVRRTDGRFDYGGGHMQKHAALNGLAALDSSALAQRINGALGTSFAYSSPQLAGGVRTSAAAYATMLQRIMRGDLVERSFLFANQVPTQGPQAISSPVPEAWHYGRGHWIELDGTASSPGALGFYPWISSDMKLYGVVARQDVGGAWASVQCGREIRNTYLGTRK